MTERPIMFSPAMVRAVLAGRKTQTRRVVKPAIVESIEFVGGGADGEKATRESIGIHWGRPLGDDGKPEGREQWLLLSGDNPEEGCVPIGPGYGQPGDGLYVRETWCRYSDGSIGYLADLPQAAAEKIRWRPSMFMKRADARLWLRVTAVRLERVQDITEADAEAEGVDAIPQNALRRQATWSRRQDFAQLWDTINGGNGRGFPWRSNPWVWVIAFTRELQ